MSPQEIHDLIENIIVQIETGADLASVLAPGLIPYIVIGKAMDNAIPDLAKIVASWMDGNLPNPVEKEEVRRRLSVLSNPDLP